MIGSGTPRSQSSTLSKIHGPSSSFMVRPPRCAGMTCAEGEKFRNEQRQASRDDETVPWHSESTSHASQWPRISEMAAADNWLRVRRRLDRHIPAVVPATRPQNICPDACCFSGALGAAPCLFAVEPTTHDFAEHSFRSKAWQFWRRTENESAGPFAKASQ